VRGTYILLGIQKYFLNFSPCLRFAFQIIQDNADSVRSAQRVNFSLCYNKVRVLESTVIMQCHYG
jgi:hypothetical protein